MLCHQKQREWQSNHINGSVICNSKTLATFDTPSQRHFQRKTDSPSCDSKVLEVGEVHHESCRLGQSRMGPLSGRFTADGCPRQRSSTFRQASRESAHKTDVVDHACLESVGRFSTSVGRGEQKRRVISSLSTNALLV